MKRVITYGTFDLFHEGHYQLLKRAKGLGDYLIVGVTTEHFDQMRGKLNVIDPIVERIENVRRSGFADQIIVEDHEGQKIEDIQKYEIDILTVGSDWRGHFDYLKDYCQVVYLERTPNISSTMLRSRMFPIIRVGIVGTGRIAPRFVTESKYVSGLTVPCAYNPNRESAQEFERTQKRPCYTGAYGDFLKEVDAVYIASPHETHYGYAKEAIGRGIHVLCEKPLAFTAGEARELYRLAGERGTVLMEAIKVAYCPGFQQLLAVAKSGRIGRIRDVEACFSRIADPDSRERTDTRYGGAFLEYGGYPLIPIMKLLGLNYQRIQIDSILDDKGIDLYTKIQLRYPEGMACAKTGVGVKSEGQLVVAGTKGYILAKSPWWLTKEFEVRYEDPSRADRYEPSFQGDGLRYEISRFVSEINGTADGKSRLTPEESIAMAGIAEEFMRQQRGRKDEAGN